GRRGVRELFAENATHVISSGAAGSGASSPIRPMKTAKLEDMVRGWFVGDFNPTLIRTQDVEVGVKSYEAGAHEKWHYHKIATEVTVIISGEVEMNGKRYGKGDIIVIEPGD